MSNMKDDHDMAVEVAKALMKGDVVAYRAPGDDKVEIVPKWLVEKSPILAEGMVGVELEAVSEAHQWDAGVISEAEKQIAAEQRHVKKHGTSNHERRH